jgi:integrase
MELRFRTRPKANSQTEAYVQAYVTIEGKRVPFSTPYTIEKKLWSEGYPAQINATKKLRTDLDALKLAVDEFIEDSLKDERVPASKNQIQNFITYFLGEEKLEPFKQVIQTYIDDKEKMKGSSMKNINVTLGIKKGEEGSLFQFKKSISFHDITKDFGTAYKKWLLKEREESTVNNHLKRVRCFLKWCDDNDYTKVRLQKYFPTIKDVQDKAIIALDEIEFGMLENCTVNDRLTRICHLFLFSSYTGMRFEDTQQDFKDKVIGRKLYYTPLKDRKKKQITVPLMDEAIAILEIYDYQLPQISNQKANEYLRELFTELNLNRMIYLNEAISLPLNKCVSFHVSRKTFITIALTRGMNPKMVQAISGHKTDAIFNRYIAFAGHALENEMEKMQRGKSFLRKVS